LVGFDEGAALPGVQGWYVRKVAGAENHGALEIVRIEGGHNHGGATQVPLKGINAGTDEVIAALMPPTSSQSSGSSRTGEKGGVVTSAARSPGPTIPALAGCALVGGEANVVDLGVELEKRTRLLFRRQNHLELRVTTPWHAREPDLWFRVLVQDGPKTAKGAPLDQRVNINLNECNSAKVGVMGERQSHQPDDKIVVVVFLEPVGSYSQPVAIQQYCVCAHPIDLTFSDMEELASRPFLIPHVKQAVYGFRHEVRWESDSGYVRDLDRVFVQEHCIVGNWPEPPFRREYREKDIQARCYWPTSLFTGEFRRPEPPRRAPADSGRGDDDVFVPVNAIHHSHLRTGSNRATQRFEFHCQRCMESSLSWEPFTSDFLIIRSVRRGSCTSGQWEFEAVKFCPGGPFRYTCPISPRLEPRWIDPRLPLDEPPGMGGGG